MRYKNNVWEDREVFQFPSIFCCLSVEDKRSSDRSSSVWRTSVMTTHTQWNRSHTLIRSHLYMSISSVELLYWIWYIRTPGMWFCGGHLMVAELDVRSDTLTLCWSVRACPPLTLDLMDVGMSDGPGSGSSLGSKCGEGLTTSSTGAVASPAALDAMHVNFPESWEPSEDKRPNIYFQFYTSVSQ